MVWFANFHCGFGSCAAALFLMKYTAAPTKGVTTLSIILDHANPMGMPVVESEQAINVELSILCMLCKNGIEELHLLYMVILSLQSGSLGKIGITKGQQSQYEKC